MKNLSEITVKEQFAKKFSSSSLEEIQVVKAPGRVNLIGEHTDYNGGFVLPVAIDYYTYIAFAPRPDRKLYIVAADFDDELVIINIDEPMQKVVTSHWSNYVRGVVQEMLKKKFKLKGAQIFIAGNIPIGAGLSSSASLEIAIICALTALSGEKIDPTVAALIGQAAENNFVGCKCGIMDQLISARGENSSALLLDCEDLSTRPVSIPDDWELLIVHSGVKRGLVDSEYNTRRQQCEAAAAYFGKPTLRGVSLWDLLTEENNLNPLTFCRARHVITENARVLLTADALEAGDMLTIVKMMLESHISMRDDFNITTPSIDILVDILTSAAVGQAGVRMTGGGFGGCVIAIAPKKIIPQLTAAVEKNYQYRTGCVPTLIPAKAVAGAFASQLKNQRILDDSFQI